MPAIAESIETLRRGSPADLAFLDAEQKWISKARSKQVLPVSGWNRALAMAGRGFGKTQMGAAYARRCVGMWPGVTVHAIAPTYGDLRGIVFNGRSGLLDALPPQMVYRVNHSTFEINLINSSTIRGFSSESPDRLRGPQSTIVWGDELASWQNAEEMLANIDFSTRIAWKPKGRVSTFAVQPQRFYTTTPRPLLWLDEMVKKGTLVIRGTTYENRDNLAADFFKDIEKYEGTQIGRQELYGELLDLSEGAIIKRSWLKLWPASEPLPWLEYVMVSMDTAFTEHTFDKKKFEADPTACTVWGVFKKNKRWNLLLLECWEDMLGFPALVARAKKEMKTTYGRRIDTFFKPVVGPAFTHEQIKRPDLLVIENKGSGISLRQQLSNEGVDSFPYNPGNADKLARLHAVSHIAYHGRVWFPESAKRPGAIRNWADPLLKQLCIYAGPGTVKHDDFVDSTSQAWRVFSDNFMADGSSALLPENPKTGTFGHDLGMPSTVTPSYGRDDIEERGPTLEEIREESPYG